MSKILVDKEILEQALEALDALEAPPSGVVDHYELDRRKQALRAALAQQAEPVQEPFGYLWPTGMHPEFRFAQQKRDGVDGMPLYTAPPQRKPLTEEQIERHIGYRLPAYSMRLLLELVNGRAHGIGGDDGQA